MGNEHLRAVAMQRIPIMKCVACEWRVVLAFACLICGAGHAADPSTNAEAGLGKEFLLRTHWYQDGPFAGLTPNHEHVGCWSTAYAQILFYHRLKPHGHVTY